MNQPANMIALEKANEVRLARARLKRDIREGRLSLADAMAEEHLQGVTVSQLLCAQNRWAGVRARKALVEAANLLGLPFPLRENMRVGFLTDRQKQALLQACGENQRSAV